MHPFLIAAARDTLLYQPFGRDALNRMTTDCTQFVTSVRNLGTASSERACVLAIAVRKPALDVGLCAVCALLTPTNMHACMQVLEDPVTMQRVARAAVMLSLLTPFVSAASDGDLRLGKPQVKGAFTTGRLEVFFDGDWGGICTVGFRQFDADTACRILGFSGSESLVVSIARHHADSL